MRRLAVVPKYYSFCCACRSASEGSALHILAEAAALREIAEPLSVLATPPKRSGRASIK